MHNYTVIVPTMWIVPVLLETMLYKYARSDYVKEILIIDNDKRNKRDLNNFFKVRMLGTGKNMFVNPAWNLGVTESKTERIIIANDDIYIDEFDKLLIVIESKLKKGEVIGPHISCFTKGYEGVINIQKSYTQTRNWGAFMIMYKDSYIMVPDELKIFAGDSVQRQVNTAFDFTGIHIATKMSQTVNLFINRREILATEQKFYRKWKNQLKKEPL